MVSTQKKFDTVAEHIAGCHRVLKLGISKEYVDKLELYVSMLDDYSEKLQCEAYKCSRNIAHALFELKNAREEADEAKDIKRLRKRKTSRNMSTDDFMLWSKGRTIARGGTILHKVTKYCSIFPSAEYVYGFLKRTNIPVDIDLYNEVWSIVK